MHAIRRALTRIRRCETISRPVLAVPRLRDSQSCHAAVGEDELLLERIADGDHDAFEILYRRYARPVLALAQRRLGDAGRAEDALQEAFVSVWRSASTYRPDRGAATTWLYAVARNAIADRGRRRQELPAEPSDQPSSDAGPDELAEQEWLRWRVHSALESLNESERELIVLAYWGASRRARSPNVSASRSEP